MLIESISSRFVPGEACTPKLFETIFHCLLMELVLEAWKHFGEDLREDAKRAKEVRHYRELRSHEIEVQRLTIELLRARGCIA